MNTKGRSSFYFNLIGHVSLISMGGLSFSEEKWRRSDGEVDRQRWRGEEGKLQLDVLYEKGVKKSLNNVADVDP